MNKRYWEKFYKNHKIDEPTDFAKFVMNYIPKYSKILDLGCGTGRDTYYFGMHGFETTGVDYAYCPKNKKNTFFIKKDINLFYNRIKDFDVVYSRFFIQAIKEDEINELIVNSKDCLFLSEFRIKGDKPLIYNSHKRTLLEGETVLNILLKNNFKIIFFKKGYDMARFKNENPYVARIIAINENKTNKDG